MTSPSDLAKTNTIIIGAGPAGLAVGACLSQAGVPCTLLEQADKVGSAWHRHYERLHLHTAKAYSALPHFSFPAEYPRYPSRLQLISYLEAYARHFKLDVRFGERVTSARHANDAWGVQTQTTRYQAQHLVIAAGYNREAFVPTWPGQNSFRGTIVHSSAYRNGEPFKGRNVLVVGFGNSGGEIAIDLFEHGAKPSLAVRSPVNVIPRELFGIPLQAFGLVQKVLPPRLADLVNAPLMRLVIGDLTPYGLKRQEYGPLSQIHRDHRIPLIDIGTIKLIKEGKITVHPGLERFTEDGVVFIDGTQAKYDAVILATGYRPLVADFLMDASAACDERGAPSSSGSESPISGLFFCGYRVTPGGVLREIAAEAQRIGTAIAQREHATIS